MQSDASDTSDSRAISPSTTGAASAPLEGSSELDKCTPHRWPGRSGVHMPSAESCEEEPECDALDASIEELHTARLSAEKLVDELLPAFTANSDDQVIAVSVDVVDLLLSAALSTNDEDLNPDPRMLAPQRVLHRYFTRSRVRPAATVSPSGQLSRPSAKRKAALPEGDALTPGALRKKLKVRAAASNLPPPPHSAALDVEPPAVTYAMRQIRTGGELVPAQTTARLSAEEAVYAPVPFSFERLTYDPRRANAAKNQPRPPLPEFPPPKKKRTPRLCDLARTARRNLQRTTQVLAPVQVAGASSNCVPAFETTNVAKSGNCGSVPRWRRDAVRRVYGTPLLTELLGKMQLVPYDFDEETDTVICDRRGRGITFRSKVVADIRPGESLINKLTAEVQLFVANCPISAEDREANLRGHHFFCVMGIHRQYSREPYETSFHRKYRRQIEWLMSPGSALSRYTLLLTILIERRFPSLAERMLNNAKWHHQHSRIDGNPILPQFGLFWNCCINAPSPEVGVERVVAAPHADSKNVAALFCALLAFWADGLVGEDEWSWLVLWDLGIVIQCPRGAFILYPSALILHFNARIVKCRRGERPTRQNSTEIPAFVNGGRGSVVWFCQASMYSCTEEGMDGRTHEERVRDFIPVVLDPAVLGVAPTP